MSSSRRHPVHRPVLYPDRYVWYVLVSALDIMLTVTVLAHLGMREANTFAQWSIDQFGTWGLIGLKFLSVIAVVMICEFIGRRDGRRGRRLATAAIAISLLPITAALSQTAYLAAWGDVRWEDWPSSSPPVPPLPWPTP
jgi:uncharacterized membrane protein